MNEADCLDVCAIFEKSFADAMHSIHHSAITRENDGEGEIRLQHQPRVIDDLAAGQSSRSLVAPVWLVQFTDR
jgi:hypothetical protein